MPARATGAARSSRVGGVRRLALAFLAGGIALAASAQSYRIPDLKPPPPRIAPAPRAGEPCDGCGRIASIREVSTVRGPTASAIAPVPGSADHSSPTQQNLIGAVIHLPLGGQRTDKPYIGGVGTPEMYARMRETSYEIAVRLDDGTIRVVRRADAEERAVGDRVRWLGGDELELLAS